MSTATRKPVSASQNPNRRSFVGQPSTPSRGTPPPGANGTPTTNGLGRRNTLRDGSPAGTPGHRSSPSLSGTPVSARSAAKRRGEDATDAELESAAAIEELKARLSANEETIAKYETSIQGLNDRLLEAVGEQGRLEEALHAKEEENERLKAEVKEMAKFRRELEARYEADRDASSREKEEMYHRERELTASIQRLKEQLAEKRSRSMSTAVNSDAPDFAPPLPTTPKPDIVLQKDRQIQELRLEIADLQTQLELAKNHDGGRVVELEQELLDLKLNNARLMEESYKFQTFMQFSGGADILDAVTAVHSPPLARSPSPDSGVRRGSSSGLGSLADELEEAESHESDKYRKLESEYKLLKDQNKSLTAYINKMIERLLEHKDFEKILDKTSGGVGGIPSMGSSSPNTGPSAPPPTPATAAPQSATKALPPVPQEEPEARPINPISRTKSLAARRASMKPMPSPPVSPDGTEPSPGLVRSQSMRQPSHSRSRSDASNASVSAATVVNNMRGTTMGNTRPSLLNPNRLSLSSTGSMDSPVGGPGGNKLRPLRLVEETGMKSPPLSGGFGDKANRRASWLGGWFGGNKAETSPAQEEIVFERRDVE